MSRHLGTATAAGLIDLVRSNQDHRVIVGYAEEICTELRKAAGGAEG